MDNEPTQSERKKTWLTEGILIASVPVYVYILLLSFVVGYCDFFRIPISFVSLNLPTMFWIGLRLEFGLLFMLFIVTIPWILRFDDHKITNTILLILPFAGLLVMQIVLRLPWRDWLWSLGAIVFLAIGGLTLFQLLPRAPSNLRRNPDALNVLGRVFPVFTLLMISVSVAMNMGRAEAINQHDYMVPASAPTTVVLSHFGEMLVVAPFDRSTKEVEPSFWVIKTGEDPKLLLRWESVGPLHLKLGGGSPSTPASATTPPQPSKTPASGPGVLCHIHSPCESNISRTCPKAQKLEECPLIQIPQEKF